MTNHHSTQKCTMVKMLVDQALHVREFQYLAEELKHLNNILQANWVCSWDVKRVLCPRSSIQSDATVDQVTNGPAFLPEIRDVMCHIGKLLERYGVQPIVKPMYKIQQYQRSVKDTRDLLSSCRVYRLAGDRVVRSRWL